MALHGYFSEFVIAECVKGAGKRIFTTVLHNDFEDYLARIGFNNVDIREIGKAVSATGIRKRKLGSRGHRYNVYEGISLKRLELSNGEAR
jgi:hypothetical protein